MNIPKAIRDHIQGKSFTPDDIGMSGSKVMISEDGVLKIVKKQLENEDAVVEMMRWLEGKIPVPKVIAYEKDDEYQYVFMSKVSGTMACDVYFLEHPEEMLRYLAEALRMLWHIDISDCPRIRSIDVELEEARYRVENDLVDLDNVEPTTFGKGGFENPKALLTWLVLNRFCPMAISACRAF